MGEQEFKIISVAHAGPQTVAFLGDRFDGAPLTRVFQVPDAHSGAPLAPVHTVPADLTDPNQAGDAFIRIHKRTTGDHLVMFAKLAGTLDIRMGIANDAELASYAIDDAAPVASLGPLSGIPQNGELVFTNDALVLAGISDANPDIIKLIIAHRADGVRFAADMPFPDPTILPANRSLISVAHSVLDEGLFDAIGGDLAFSWIFEVDGNHQRLFYGEASCSAQ
jgi:hypothetical protein